MVLILLMPVIYLLMYFWVLPRALPYLPSKYVEEIIKYEVSNAIEERGAFPRGLLSALIKHPILVTPSLYEQVARMLVMAQDQEIKDTIKLIKLINSNALYCFIVPNFSLEGSHVPTDFSGQTIANATGEPKSCREQ